MSVLEWEQRAGMVTGKYRWKTGGGCRDGNEGGLLDGKGGFLYPPAGELKSELVRRLTSESLLPPSPNLHVVADHAGPEGLPYQHTGMKPLTTKTPWELSQLPLATETGETHMRTWIASQHRSLCLYRGGISANQHA